MGRSKYYLKYDPLWYILHRSIDPFHEKSDKRPTLSIHISPMTHLFFCSV